MNLEFAAILAGLYWFVQRVFPWRPDMRRMVVLGGIVMVGALAVGLRAQQPAPAEPKAADIEKVRDNLYIITTR